MGFLTDFNSDTKGVSILGGLLAVVVLGGFGLLGMLTLGGRFNGSDAAKAREQIRIAGREIGHLDKAIEEASRRLQTEKETLQRLEDLPRLEAELGALTSQVSEMGMELAKVQGQTASAENSRIELAQDRIEHLKGYRKAERSSAKGEKLAVLVLNDGTRYEDVTIGTVDATGLTVRLPSGPKNVEFQKLPKELQRRFQFAEEEARMVKEELDQAEADLARQVASAQARASERNAAAAIEKETADAVAGKDYLAKLLARRATVQQQIIELRQKAEQQRAQFLSARARGNIASDESTRTMGQVKQLESSLKGIDRAIAAQGAK